MPRNPLKPRPLRIKPAAVDPAEAWRYLDDVGPSGAIGIPAQIYAAELVDLMAVEAPPAEPRPVPEPWTGPTSPMARGQENGRARLTAADVREIRRLHAAGRSIYSLAPEFGVSKSAVRAIVRRQTWQDA